MLSLGGFEAVEADWPIPTTALRVSVACWLNWAPGAAEEEPTEDWVVGFCSRVDKSMD